METVKSRSESPFSKSKAKSHLSDASENGNMAIEQIKAKKKGYKSKCKSSQTGKENENTANNGKDYPQEEEFGLSELSENTNSNNTEQENGVNNGNNYESSNGDEEVQKQVIKENVALINVCDVAEECVSNESNCKLNESRAAEECKNHQDITAADIVEENSKDNDSTNALETENGTETPSDLLPDSNSACEVFEEKVIEGSFKETVEETNNSFNQDTDIYHEVGETVNGSDVKESSNATINGSENNAENEDAKVNDNIQASPDTATKDDNSFSNKISNFFGKLSYSYEQRQDSEVSSSKKIEGTLNHPYLSRVSGRRGIKDRLNSSATVFSSSEMEVKTPENSGISLDDSFRVRTNPPRLTSMDLQENPTLRKFKGKRCLNAGDEPEEDDDVYFNTMKKRKLDEKSQESGLWGSILWRSPFKKKSIDNEDQLKLATNESKLSRLLSPFWFWKKTAAGQKGK